LLSFLLKGQNTQIVTNDYLLLTIPETRYCRISFSIINQTMFNLQRRLFSALLLFTLTFFAFSCEKDNLQPNSEGPTDPVEVRSMMASALGQALSKSDTTEVNEEVLCFTFNFPLTFLLEDGTTLTVDNEAAIDDIPEATVIADFVYPFTITLTDGTPTEVNSFDDFLSILTGCFGDFEDWEDYDEEHGECPIDFDFEDACFDFIYPISITDSVTVTVINSEDEFYSFLEGLTEETAENLDFVFPFSVQVDGEEGETVIEDYDDLDDLFEDCYDDDYDYDEEDYEDCPSDFDFADACFSLVYPISVTDSVTVTVINSEEEFLSFLEGLTEEAAEGFDFVFPFNIQVLGEEMERTITSYDDLEDVFEACFDIFEGEWEEHDDCPADFEFGDACFDLVYPISLTDSVTVTVINSEEEFFSFLEGLTEEAAENIDFVFPFNIQIEGEEMETTIANYDELEAVFVLCYELGGDDEELPDFDECYAVNYPVSVTITPRDGEVREVVVNNDDELGHLLALEGDLGASVDLVFPFTVTDRESGEVITVEDEEALDDLIDSCDD